MKRKAKEFNLISIFSLKDSIFSEFSLTSPTDNKSESNQNQMQL